MVAADLMKRGYKILIPWGDDFKFDIALYRSNTNTIERIQVKYISKVKGSLPISNKTSYMTSKGIVKTKYGDNDYDWIAVYCPDTDEVYYISKDSMCGKWSFYLRIDSLSKKQVSNRIHWGVDYKII